MARGVDQLLVDMQTKPIHTESMPAVMTLETVRGCPYSCAFCKLRKSKYTMMPEPLLEKLEPYFKDLEVLAIHAGGEPTLGNIGYYVDQSVKHDFCLHMMTTAAFLTKKRADLLSQTRLSIYFSLHSANPQSYKRVMGGDFDKVIRNIRYVVERSKANGADHDFLISFMILKETVDDVATVLHLAADIGIDRIRFMSCTPGKNSLLGLEMTDDFKFKYFEQFSREVRQQFLAELPKHKKLADELGIDVETGTMEMVAGGLSAMKENANRLLFKSIGKKIFPLIPRKGECVLPWAGEMVITQDGNVDLCCWDHYSLGNLNDNTLAEIWNGDPMKKIRGALHKGHMPRSCSYCPGHGLEEFPRNAFRDRPEEYF